MPTIEAAYPFIRVTIDTSDLMPTAQRAPGVIAIVGRTSADGNAGTATANKPYAIDTLDQAADLFAGRKPDGTVIETPLYASLKTAFLQDPKPSKVYGVKIEGETYAAGLGGLEAADDVTFVALAKEATVGGAAAGGNPATGLMALKDHCENMSAAGQKRIGVAMVDPTTAKSNTYCDDVKGTYGSLKSDSSRMILVAARGATTDVASAAMSAIAGYEPHISAILKRVRGVSMPIDKQFSPTEIKTLSEENIIPIIDPALIVGEGLHFAEARCYTTDPTLLYIDVVRTLDDIEFRLKAGLIGMIGDARITKSGMTSVKTRVEGILGPLKRRAVIDNFNIDMPVLTVLEMPESAWTETDRSLVTTARANRTVDMVVTVTYGPQVHRLLVTLKPKF